MNKLLRFLPVLALLALVLVTASAYVPTAQAATGQTFTVLVGAENTHLGVGIMAYFPSTLHVHVGDTVHWQQNAHEIHTVSFNVPPDAQQMVVPAIQPNPLKTPLMINPLVAFPVVPAGGQYDGTSYANSGIMSLDPGMGKSFDLTFVKPGTYTYYCLVHGMMMSGSVFVDDDSVAVPSPSQVSMSAAIEIAQQIAKGVGLYPQAQKQVPAPTRNPDGTTTYHILAGYDSGQLALMRFFPSRLVVHPGDTVEWITGDAPHTVTFLNRGPDIPFAVFWLSPQGPELLANPEVLIPLNPGQPLTRAGVYSSGFLPAPGMKYSLVIGDTLGLEPYECLLHDTSGMQGSLFVAPGH